MAFGYRRGPSRDALTDYWSWVVTSASSRMACDVVVIGAGPAGIAAATRAAEAGRRVVVLDESPQVGGQIWRHRPGRVPSGPAARCIARLERSRAMVERGASVVDIVIDPSGNGCAVMAERAGAPLVVQGAALILATGARERFLPFPGWTLPGVIGVGAAQALHKTGMSFAGKRVVIAGSGPLLLPVAASLAADGARIALVAEQASGRDVMRFAAGLWRHPATLVQAARYRAAFMRTTYATGQWVTHARGDGRVQEVIITDGWTSRTMPCDILCAAFGLVPDTTLARLLGCVVNANGVVVDERQETSRLGVYCAGEPTGVGGMELSLVEGEIAGLSAAGRPDEARPLHARRASLRASAAAMARAFALRDELRSLATPDTIVCRCEDVPLGAVDRGWTTRQAKLYTRAGMGACQGRVCGAALEYLNGWPPDAVRVPAIPVRCSTLTSEGTERVPSATHGA
ncbi:MAG: FAD/NAD(P)-binding oxidoreductase [bacterium]